MITCEHCKDEFEISAFESALRSELAPSIANRKFPLPSPKVCPICRHRRRLAFRNERKLYRNFCAISKRPIISSYSPDKPDKVVSRSEWLELDNTQFGREYDFNRSFFSQFQDLTKDTYKANVAQAGEIINSEYTHSVGWLKDCYLLFDSGKDEECAYGTFMAYSKNCFDVTFGFYCELCYDCVKIENCYGLIRGDYCKSSSNSAFLRNCIGCKNCLGCVNLRNQEYYVFNEFVGKEQFEKIWAECFDGNWSSYKKFERRFLELHNSLPRRATYNLDSVNSTGDSLIKCQNVENSFEVLEANGCCNLFDIFSRTEKSCDVTGFGEGIDYSYETTQTGGAIGKSAVSNIFFSVNVYYGGYNVFYSMNCHENCQNLFGCSELRKKNYCILNKQYSKDEYETLVPQIIDQMAAKGEWGDFFPFSLSPYGYNESLAQEEFPLDISEAKALGTNWSEYFPPSPNVTSLIQATSLDRVDDSLLSTAIQCEESQKPFKVIPLEFAFLKRFKLPPPRKHPELRERDRRLRKNARRIEQRNCGNCNLAVDSAVNFRHLGPILCEQCYEKELY